MNNQTILLLLLFCFIRNIENIEPISSKVQSERVDKLRCGYNLDTLWTAELAHSPFAAAPLISDVDGNSKDEIIAAPFSESFTVLQGQNGQILHHSSWPAVNLDNSVHASPLQFDIDHDGMLDIMFTLSSGELRFYSPDGVRLKDKTYQIDPVYVSKAWYQYELILNTPTIDKYAFVEKPKGDEFQHVVPVDAHFQHVVPVDAHVLSTPVLVDLNNDKRVEELVISVSYFFEEDDFLEKGSNKKEQLNGLKYEDIGKFLLSGITVVNLTTLEPLWTKILDLTQITAEFPAYNLFTPTVVDIQGDFSPLEIVLGTSAGNLYMLDHTGQVKDGWPKSSGSIHGQITVADLNGDDILDIVAIDTSGDVICYNSDGKTQWEIQITGTSTAGSRLYDVNNDNVLDVIITTNVGDIFALDGINGQILPNWPVQLGKKISSNVLITKISTAHSTPDMLVLTDDGYLHVISMDLKCKTKFTLGETTLVQLLAHDLVEGSEGLEILVATNDGALICLGSSEGPTDIFIDEEKDKERLKYSLQSETKSPNDFIFGSIKPNLYITQYSRIEEEVTGSEFYLEYAISDMSKKAGPYEIRVYFGFHLLQNTSHAGPGVYSIKVPAFDEPSHGHIIVVMRNKHGMIVTDSYTIRFNRLIMEDLQWLLVTPFIAMLIILLVLHGFPMKDLLPYTHQSKTR
ncbi:uncharacterized protein LOC134710372 [Mytilus trossulus]|uniref:uncharacterized protein LOC134710372 n=1 Tax=Mytilus trossulus TaxID=6551 RepID=UPI003007E5F6